MNSSPSTCFALRLPAVVIGAEFGEGGVEPPEEVKCHNTDQIGSIYVKGCSKPHFFVVR